MKNPFDARAHGAETKADVGTFLLFAGIGGIADAVANVAGFAEPFVFAPLCGTAALGAKKIIDGYMNRPKTDGSDDSDAP